LATTSTGRPDLRDVVVEGRQARAGVHHEEHQVRLVDGGEHLAAHGVDQRLVRGGIEAARVHHRRLPLLERDQTIQPVSRDAGDVSHEGLAAADETVEERGFAHVRPPDDGEDGPEH
jgi:hypothetical protein